MNRLKFNLITTTVFLTTFTLTSCKKYTCECTAYNTNNPESGGRSNYTVKNKDKAKVCTDKSTQPDSFGNYTTCVIK
jgi:hypothetical protein